MINYIKNYSVMESINSTYSNVTPPMVNAVIHERWASFHVNLLIIHKSIKFSRSNECMSQTRITSRRKLSLKVNPLAPTR